ncbi:MAG: Ig-like domain-containing protein [Pseudomonadales bacterium]|nr:Ig-like domain-containing protein [Pseudomonadales bacterium]
MKKTSSLYVLILLSTLLLSACNPWLLFWKEAADDDTSINTYTPVIATPVRLRIEAEHSSLPRTTETPLYAYVDYDNGYSQNVTYDATWNSSNPLIASVVMENNQLIIKAVSAGEATITASYQKEGFPTTTGHLLFTINSAELTAITINPTNTRIIAGYTQKYTAQGTFNNGRTYPITRLVNWLSSNETAATIDKGLATGLIEGASEVSATWPESTISSNTANLDVQQADLLSIELNPQTASLIDGNTLTLSAKATFSNGVIIEDASAFTWSSSNSAVTVDENGKLTTNYSGSANIIAKIDNSPSSAASIINVTDAVITELTVTSTAASVAEGLTLPFEAQAMLSNGETENVTKHEKLLWLTSDIDIATIDGDGIARTHQQGSTDITAVLGIMQSSANLMVTEAEVTSLSITPNNRQMIHSISSNTTFTAMLNYTNGDEIDVSRNNGTEWSSDNDAVMTIDQQGIATSEGPVTAQVKAENGNSSSASYFTADSCYSIVFEGLEYTCPMRTDVARMADIAYTEPQADNTNREYYAAFNWSAAENTCKALQYNNKNDWRLASADELNALFAAYESSGGVYGDANWSVSIATWSSDVFDDQRHVSVDLWKGNNFNSSDSSSHYTTCVQ